MFLNLDSVYFNSINLASIFSSSALVGNMPPHTSSTIVAEGVSWSHVLTIRGYSYTLGFGVGEAIPAGLLRVGGHIWCIAYHPDGFNTDSIDCISFSLFLHEADVVDDDDDVDAQRPIRIRCRFSLLDHVGEPVPNHTTPYTTSICYKRRQGITSHRFITRADLENSTHLKDDCFSIKFDISVTKFIRKPPTTQEFVMVPPSDMAHQFGRILETGEVGDVTFEVRGETFVAHRHLLAARSAVFMAQLFGPMKENDAKCIQIDDMEAKVFKMMLHFIYTDALPSIDEGEITEMAQHLFVAADRYNLERLKLICANILCNHMEVNTVATTLALAEQHGCDKLKEVCYRFLTSFQNLKAVTLSDGFRHLKIICPNILEDLLGR
ncbi:BTB/POZ and MATH domain-containing protein 2-like [Hordeum vulgare]|uniref:BTB domain-containing protein n=1 Tax=Hordeum vulgare subsp. vulgare TaxID=112509 RepID=A0A8I6X212_HORVV|nr:BTB/POZ and MATH domain-containing protein 2-like [Hordeum vulgare subsp. vulgare]KAE8782268.1 BTB/POZ and MATH domain-containing protein 2-like [Hordeum vulgare]KAI5016370.1 hypothetical protein ZWY2020_006221 [Hordeum vulgare]